MSYLFIHVIGAVSKVHGKLVETFAEASFTVLEDFIHLLCL